MKAETVISLILTAIVAIAILYPIITSVPEEEEIKGAWRYENGTVADPRNYNIFIFPKIKLRERTFCGNK